jgi:protein unc-45
VEQSRKAGDNDGAIQALNAASSIDPTNKLVQQSLKSLESSLENDTFTALLNKFYDSADEAIGKKALQALSTRPPEAADAIAALDILLRRSSSDSLDDQLLGSLLNISLDVRKELASRLKTSVTVLFDQFYAAGLQSFRAFAGLTLNESALTSKSDRDAAQRDVFQLCIAKLMDTSVDHPERILEAMTRQLTMAPSTVKGLIDADVFESVLTNLDIRKGPPVRSQAMLTAAKMFEVTAERGEKFFADFITSSIAKKTSQDLVVAFSAASAVFPIVATVAAKLFLTEGFVQQLVPTLERNSHAAMQGHR